MPNTTKAALEESLKRLLLKKPLDRITITDITTDCGICLLYTSKMEIVTSQENISVYLQEYPSRIQEVQN